MALADLCFSDLLLFSDGSAKLKGAPGAGSQLVPIPAECADEVASLPTKLADAALTKKKPTIRYCHDNVYYRVALLEEVGDSKVWFMRRLAKEVPMLAELKCVPYLQKWLLSPEQRQGLILISGAQASGKTTFASSFVANRLALFGGHAVTLEGPAELPLSGPWGSFGYCFQTEFARESDLPQEIEAAHRYGSPDIIFIGEIRSLPTAREALRVALGSNRQIVVTTIHGQTVGTALDRLLTWAKEVDGQSACQNLADALLGVIHLSLEHGENGTVLNSPEHLLLPFESENVRGIRAKLREGQVHMLADDIREQKALMREEGKI